MNSAQEFRDAGPMLPDGMRLFIREETESTNDDARALGQSGAAHGTIVVSDRQTSGRGRRGAPWISPPGQALAFSIIARPCEPVALWPRLALAAGAAVADALEELGFSPAIKWPNDVWIGHRKVCGILVEAAGDFAVIGIGVNVNVPEFPPDLSDTATSLLLESGSLTDRASLLASILLRLDLRWRQIGSDFSSLLDAVRVRCALTGQRVRLLAADGVREGFCEGVGDGGELLLSEPAGLERILQADEVRILPPP